MARLVDYIANQKHIPVPSWHPNDVELSTEQREFVKGVMQRFVSLNEINISVIPKVPTFEVTNVHKYVSEKTTDIYKDWPCLMLPIDLMWMEYGRGVSRDPSHVGAFFMRRDDSLSDGRWEFEDTPERSKYCISVTMYWGFKHQAYGPCALWDVALDERGAPVEYRYMNMPAVAKGNPNMDSNKLILEKMAPFFQALAFMHCKNLRYMQEEADEKVSKKWKKKTGKPLSKWNTLIIDPLRDVLAREKRGSSPGAITNQSLHIARGHFAEYGDEFGKGKLFGKYEGRFWIPQHVRGDKKEGTISHDYEIKV